jgi:methyl-accepting chemotaxis protein
VLVINQLASDSQSISRVLEVIKSIAEQPTCWPSTPPSRRRGPASRAVALRWWPMSAHPGHPAIHRRNRTDDRRLHDGVAAAVKAMGTSHEMANGTVGSRKSPAGVGKYPGAVGMIVDQNQQIAAAVEQQTAVAHDIDQNIVEINRAGEHAAEGAHQTEAASRAVVGAGGGTQAADRRVSRVRRHRRIDLYRLWRFS